MFNLPPGPRAALEALHLAHPCPPRLCDADWRAALEFSNRSQITLALRRRARAFMPAWVQEIVDRNHAHNLDRLAVVHDLYRAIAQSLSGIEFLALKGLTQCPLFGSQAEDRPQYDVDLYAPRAAQAHGQLRALGFEPMEGMERFPTDHLPALIRKTGWQYRGDVFDPAMPLAIEIHFQFWNGALERLPVDGLEAFWDRRVVREPLPIPALAPPDALAYACLHLLKHILRSSARPFHLYEIACFLDSHAADETFFAEWRALHPPALRRLQAVAFRFAAEWFGCRLAGAAAQEVAQLPGATSAWFDRFAHSPAAAPFDANKDELWLHLSLLTSPADKFAVARRRLFPTRLPAPIDAVHLPADRITAPRRALKSVRWLLYAARRMARHAAALPAVARSGAALLLRR